MIAVSDTSPLCYLALIGEEDLLPALFDEIWIPPAVASELTRPKVPREVTTWLAGQPAWLRLAEAPDTSPLPVTPRLHLGEEQAIAVGMALKPDFVLLDDRTARKVARDLGLTLMGTLAVLQLGARRGHIDLPSSLTRLARTNFRVTPELLRNLLP